MKYKILFFDSWKGGIRIYQRLLEAMDRIDADPMLLHLGSWGNEPEFVMEENIGGLKVRDIKYYNTTNFLKVLKAEKPDLVLFLSTHTFAHRAMVRCCRLMKIPTINLYHGFVRVQAVDGGASPYKVNKLGYIKFALQRLPKMLTLTLPCYIGSLIRTNASVSDWKQFFTNLIEVFTRPSSLRVADDARTTRCLIYADADKLHAMQTYGFRNEDIVSVGNPDLLTFGIHQEAIAFGLKRGQSEVKQEIMYVDTAMFATGLIFKSKEEFTRHLLDTYDSLRAQGYKMIFKPHPDTRKKLDMHLLENAGLEVVQNEDLLHKLASSVAVITEPSTLSLIPCLMGLPVFLASYGKLNSLKYGQVLLEYPLAMHLTEINDLRKQIEGISKVDNHVLDWIKENLGPWPATEMPDRVASNVVDLIDRSARVQNA